MDEKKNPFEALLSQYEGALITEGFGHGFASLGLAIAAGFEQIFAQDEQILAKFKPFYPNLQLWDGKTEYWNVRESILKREISHEMWRALARVKLIPTLTEDLPQFKNLAETDKVKVHFVPAKLITDGQCGLSASQQSVSPEVFSCLKDDDEVLPELGQHFNKEKDGEDAVNLIEEFEGDAPGYREEKEVWGIRGVPHIRLYNFYRQMDISIGIAGTHTWYMLLCMPEISQGILNNTGGIEDWADIALAYREEGYNIQAIGYNEKTEMLSLEREVEEVYNSLLKTVKK